MAEVCLLERINPGPALPMSSVEFPIIFFEASWLFTGPVKHLFFYCHVDPAAALSLLAASLPHMLCRFFPLLPTRRHLQPCHGTVRSWWW